MKKILTNPLISGSALLIGGSMAINVINYAYHLLMGRILGPSNYGVLASLFSILYILSIVPLSTSVVIVKFISSAKKESEKIAIYQSVRSLIFKISIILSLLIVILTPFIANFLHIKDYIAVLMVAPVLYFSLITLVNQATSQSILKFVGVVGPNFISSFVKLVLGIILVIIGFSVFGAMFAVVFGVFLAYLYSKHFINKNFDKKIKKQYELSTMLKFSLPVLLQALAFTSIFTTDVILVKHFFPPFEAGLYAALSTLGKIIYFAASPITQAMFPIVSKKSSSGEKYFKIFLSSLLATFIISLVIVVFYYLFPNIAIGLLYGEKYMKAQLELVWMGLFILVYSLCYIVVNFMLSIGKTKIIIFPLIASITQIIMIAIFHNSLMQVIQLSLFTMTILLFVLIVYLTLYNRKNFHEKG